MPFPRVHASPKKKCLTMATKMEQDSAKALAAAAAIRQMVEAASGRIPTETHRQDAQRELEIIRENSPQSCKGKIGSVSGWLNMLFATGKDREFGTKDPHDIVVNILARIEAEIAQTD